MYLILPTDDVLNNFISPDMEPLVDRSQRAFEPRHATDIGQYIVNNEKDYVLGALTYAVDQEGEFEAVEDGASIGVLHLPLSAKLRSIDGQHRRRGIKEAIDLKEWVNADHTAVIVYVESEVEKRKQMFSDMNWTVRQVSKSVNINFNTRDTFARATNLLVESHPLLEGRIETERAWITKGSNHIFTLGAVYDALRRLQFGPDRNSRKDPPVDQDELIEKGQAFFSLLLEARQEFNQVLEDASITEELRKTTILVNGTTLKVLAGAFHLVTRDGTVSIESLKTGLSHIDFRPDAEIWRKSGFVAPDKTTPLSRNQEVRAATLAVRDALLQDEVIAA